MQKIFFLIFGALFVLNLSGCASMYKMNMPPLAKGKHVYSKGIFSNTLVTASLANAMGADDKAHVVHLINTARLHQTETWKSDSSSNAFEFTSLNIFVDDHGRACRTYKVRGLIYGSERGTSEMTACRMDDGNWQGI
jgi:surface antigen